MLPWLEEATLFPMNVPARYPTTIVGRTPQYRV
jgi:hypothetical protein